MSGRPPVLVADEAALSRAVELLHAGRLVAFPTETVYGLGADAARPEAVGGIFAAKGRPADHPVIVHMAGAAELSRWGTEIPPEARVLAARFWPGPLTLVVRRAPGVPDAVTGGLPTVGLRVPAHPVALALLGAFGGGLAAPSANRFGSLSPTTAAAVADELGPAVDLVLDGGPCQVGVESTIVDLSSGEPSILRPGGVPREALEDALGRRLPVRSAAGSAGAVRAPGMLESHYAPRAALELVPAAGLLDRARALVAQGRRVAVLSAEPIWAGVSPGFELVVLPPGAEARARALYATLRALDGRGIEVIVASLPDEVGLDLAIADRLRRASAPRR